MGGRRWVRWTVAALLLGGAATVGVWPRNDVPRDPDAVIVLGGAGYERVDLGVELRDRYDAVLVLSWSAVAFGEARGLTCGSEVLCIYPRPRSTTGEARAVAEMAEERGWDHVTVATTGFHTARARVLFRQCLSDRVTVVGAPPLDGGPHRGFRNYLKEVAGVTAGLTFRRAC
jgi:hypothetical protein